MSAIPDINFYIPSKYDDSRIDLDSLDVCELLATDYLSLFPPIENLKYLKSVDSFKAFRNGHHTFLNLWEP